MNRGSPTARIREKDRHSEDRHQRGCLPHSVFRFKWQRYNNRACERSAQINKQDHQRERIDLRFKDRCEKPRQTTSIAMALKPVENKIHLVTTVFA